ncbi:10119_t:CDS:2, partial [Cetraspora pellucida]
LRKIRQEKKAKPQILRKTRALALVPRKRKMIDTGAERKRVKTQDSSRKNQNKENESSDFTNNQKVVKEQKSHTGGTLTDLTSHNTDWAEDTEAAYRKGKISLQKDMVQSAQSSLNEKAENSTGINMESTGINPDTSLSEIESCDSEGSAETDLETMRIEEEKANGTTAHKVNDNIEDSHSYSGDNPYIEPNRARKDNDGIGKTNDVEKATESTSTKNIEITEENTEKEIEHEMDLSVQRTPSRAETQNLQEITPNDSAEDQEMNNPKDEEFTLVTRKKRSMKSSSVTDLHSERHKPYKRGGGNKGHRASITKMYEQASNSKVNTTKTILIPLTQSARDTKLEAPMERHYKQDRKANWGFVMKAALNRRPVKLKGWPEHWRPYVNAWKRVNGRIEGSAESWPWNRESLSIANASGEEFSVKSMSRYLKEIKLLNIKNRSQLIDEAKKNSWKWMNIKWVPNVKKNIYWRLQHKALPLGYRLKYINPEDPGECPSCPSTLQTIDHFAIDCPTSKKIWNLALELVTPVINLERPINLDAMFNDQYTGNVQLRNWIYINAIYEIWYWYSQAKWGNPIPVPILDL